MTNRDPEEVVSELLDGSSHHVYVGIDPGSTGAIAFLSGSRAAAIDIPVYTVAVTRDRPLSEEEAAKTGKKTKSKAGHKTEFDIGAIVRIFDLTELFRDRITVCLEQIPPSLGPGKQHAEISLNKAWAMWPLYLASLKIPVEHVTPRKWKQAMGLLKADKAQSFKTAQALFPNADLRLVKHHDRAEALLLAEYARRQREGIKKKGK